MRQFVFSVACLVATAPAAPASAQHRGLPPSHPQMALQLGQLDRIVPHESASGLFVCTSTTFALKFSDPAKNTRYYKFEIFTGRARLIARMRETPDASLWFVLRDRDLKWMREFKGGDDQLAQYELSSGTYYLQLVTDASQNRRPDGTNLAEISFRAFPAGYFTARPAQPISLGALEGGSRVARYMGVLAAIRHRQFPFPISEGKSQQCPTLAGSERIDAFHEFVFTAPAGRMATSIAFYIMLNWPASELGVFRRTKDSSGLEYWQPLNIPFMHPGGVGRLAVGRIGTATIINNDRYAEYDFQLQRLN